MNFWDINWGARGAARVEDPETSHEAADSVKTAPLESVVLDALKTAPEGCTADELAVKLPNIPMNTLTPRFASLIRKGLIKDSGFTRKGKSGRQQRVLLVQ